MASHRTTRSRLLGLLTVVIAAAIALTGCASQGSSASKQIRVGAIYLDSQGYYGGVKAGVTDAAKQSGLDVKFVETNPGGDVAKESTFMNTLVSSGVSAIIISAASADSSVPAIKAAHAAGIPVICYNTCVNDDAVKKYVTAYVIGDPVKFGELAGDSAAKYFQSKGIANPKIGVINCEQYEVCKQRLQGFESALTKAVPGAKIVSNQEGAEVDRAVPTAQQMLTANPDLNGFYGEAGGATIGAYKAVDSANRTDIGVFGSDMTTDIATELSKGTGLQAVVDISGIAVGKLAWAQVEKAIKSKSNSLGSTVAAPIKLWTPTDAQSWLDTHKDGLP